MTEWPGGPAGGELAVGHEERQRDSPTLYGEQSIEQLSPGSPFNVRESPHEYLGSSAKRFEPEIGNQAVHFASQQAQPSKRDTEIEMSMEMSQHLLKQLEEKDNRINQLSDYVEALKKDLAL